MATQSLQFAFRNPNVRMFQGEKRNQNKSQPISLRLGVSAVFSIKCFHSGIGLKAYPGRRRPLKRPRYVRAMSSRSLISRLRDLQHVANSPHVADSSLPLTSHRKVARNDIAVAHPAMSSRSLISRLRDLRHVTNSPRVADSSPSAHSQTTLVRSGSE